MTLVVFGAGVLLGARGGALVGGITMAVFTLFNPYGPAHPLVTLAQVSGEVGAGLGGAAFAALRLHEAPPALRAGFLAVAGALLTAGFDLATNVASGLVFGQIGATLIGGIPFALIHLVTNVLLFAACGTPLVRVLVRYRSRLS